MSMCAWICLVHLQESPWAPSHVFVCAAVSSLCFSTSLPLSSPRIFTLYPLPSSSLLPPSTSPLVVELPSERAQCVDWTEGVLCWMAVSLAHRTHTTILISSHWAAAVCLAFIGDLTATGFKGEWGGSVHQCGRKCRSLFSFLCFWLFLDGSNAGATFNRHFDEVELSFCQSDWR